MQLLIEVENSKYDFFVNLLNELKFVRFQTLNKEKVKIHNELNYSKKELDDVLAGKSKSLSFEEFLVEEQE